MANNENEKPVEKLEKACHQAFKTYPDSCSHAVWYVIKQYDPGQKQMKANDLIKFLKKSSKWKLVNSSEVGKLANEGVLVVGGKLETGHGHVIVVHPGKPKKSGGYDYLNKKTGKIEKYPPQGVFPLAMSTSMSRHWNGTISDGTLTIVDSWPNKFHIVRFWKYVGNSAEHEKAHKKEAGK